MNYNKIKMPSQSESDPGKTEPLSRSIERIRSFALLEEDEELMPVAQREIERSITIIKAIYARLELMPFRRPNAKWGCWRGVSDQRCRSILSLCSSRTHRLLSYQKRSPIEANLLHKPR